MSEVKSDLNYVRSRVKYDGPKVKKVEDTYVLEVTRPTDLTLYEALLEALRFCLDNPPTEIKPEDEN